MARRKVCAVVVGGCRAAAYREGAQRGQPVLGRRGGGLFRFLYQQLFTSFPFSY